GCRQAANADIEGAVGRHVRVVWRAYRVNRAYGYVVRLLVLVALAMRVVKGELVAELVGVRRPVIAEVAHDHCVNVRRYDSRTTLHLHGGPAIAIAACAAARA